MEASDSERMEELKKAYAEIILNTAKELAARVAASEEKARRYERELSNAKGESLRLLLRLKHMISAKEIEAEMASSTNRSRIDELEAQLQEAEGVIVDLRAELDCTRDRLQKVKKNRLKPLDGNIGKDDCVLEQKCASEAEPVTPSSSGSQFQASMTDKDMAILDQKVGDKKCCKEKQLGELIGPSSFENSDSEIASRMLKSRKHLGNVFMEKDYAVDGKMLPEKLALLESVNSHSVITHDLVIKSRHELEEKCNVSSLKTRNVERMKKLLGEPRNVIKAVTLNGRKGWRGKATTNYLSHLTKPCQRPSILSRCRTYPVNDWLLTTLFNTETSDAIEVKLLHQNSCSLDKNVIAHEAKIQPNMEKDVVSTTFIDHDDQRLKGCQSPPGPSCCTSYSLSISGSVKSGETLSKLTENAIKLRPLRPGKTLIKGVGVPFSSSKTVVGNVKAVNEPGIFCGGANKETESEHGCVEVRQKVSLKSKDDYGKPSVPLEQVKKPGAAVASVPSEVSDYSDGRTSCEPHRSPNQVVGNELLKYTFQRKRKKEQLTILDQNLNPERTMVETKALDDLGGSLVPQKSRSINNSSRENRRTAQVAHQYLEVHA